MNIKLDYRDYESLKLGRSEFVGRYLVRIGRLLLLPLLPVLYVLVLLFRHDYPRVEYAAGLVLLADLIVIWLLSRFAAEWYDNQQNWENPKQVCPHCGIPLLPYDATVVATWTCPHCGKRRLHKSVKNTEEPFLDKDF
jgi:predicted RNA-binding Zn-ribbon protein involved in translation (DUF1610 family)